MCHIKNNLLKKITNLLLFLFLCSCGTNTNNSFDLEDGLFITNVTLLTTEDGQYEARKGHVVVAGETIVYVGEEAPNVEGTYDEIDGTGKFLTPGLIDSHVHATEVQGMVYGHMSKYPDLVKEFREQTPRSYLYYGYTTLINLGGISEEQIKFISDQPLKPDLKHTGRSGTSVANGYPMNFAPEQFRFDETPNFIYLESEAENTPDKFDPIDHTPAAVVKRIKETGGIAVKSYYETGFRGMPKLPVPTKEIMEDLQQNTNANGLVLTVHGNSLGAHTFLSDIGVDIIAHGLWNWEEYAEVPKDALPEAIKKVLDKQIAKQIGYTPTLTVIEGEKEMADPEFLKKPELKYVVPGKMLDWYKTEEGQWFAKELFGEYSTDEVFDIYGNIQAHAQLALKYLSDNGGLILFGTDTPSGPIYANQPGYNGYWEMKLMHEAGVPLDKILASATINNARAFQLDSIVGSLGVGKRANMVLMSKNPLKELDAYDQIESVVVGGKVIDRKVLAVQ